jgi:hypothetical protein
MDALRKFAVPMEGHDGLHMPFAKCALLNYRKKKVWDELVSDVLGWCGRGAAGVRLAAAHAAPLILRSDTKAIPCLVFVVFYSLLIFHVRLKELSRVDPSGEPHYTLSEIFEGQVCLPPTNEAVTFGFYGTDSLYANPLLIKIAMTTWQIYPDCRLFAERYKQELFLLSQMCV